MWYNNNCTLHLFSPTEPGCGVACSHSEGSVQLLLFLAASCPGYVSLVPGYTTMSDSDSRQYWRQTVDQRPGGHRQRWKTNRRPGDAPLLYNYWGNMLLGNYLGAGPWNMKFCLFLSYLISDSSERLCVMLVVLRLLWLYLWLCFVFMFCLLVVLVKLSIIAKWLALMKSPVIRDFLHKDKVGGLVILFVFIICRQVSK